MRYKLLETEREYDDLIIKFRDLVNGQQYNYYLSELSYVKLPQFKSFILPHLKDIRNGITEESCSLTRAAFFSYAIYSSPKM